MENNDFVIEEGVLKAYRGSGGDVRVPDGITGIGEEAFANCEDLINITFPDSLVHIGPRAFDCADRLMKYF